MLTTDYCKSPPPHWTEGHQESFEHDGSSFGNLETVSHSFQSSQNIISDQCDQIGQVYKAFGNNKFAQISHILRQFL